MPVRRGVEVTGFAPGRRPASTSTSPRASRCARRTWSGPTAGAASSARRPASSSSARTATRSHLIAEVEVTEETPTGIRLDERGIHGMQRDGRRADGAGRRDRAASSGPATEPTLADLGEALTGRVRHRLRHPRPDVDVAVHRRHPAGGRLPRGPGAARRRRRAHPLRPPAGRGSASGCRTRSTSAGSSPRSSRASHPTPSWTPTTRSGTRSRARVLKNMMAQVAPPARRRAHRGAARHDRRAAGLRRAAHAARRAARPGSTWPTTSARDTRCWDAGCPTSTSSPPRPAAGLRAAAPGPAGAARPRRAGQHRRRRLGRTGSGRSRRPTTARGSCRWWARSTAPSAVLVRPDGHVAWVGEGTRPGSPRR